MRLILTYKGGYNKLLITLFVISVFFAGCRNEDIVEDDNKFAAVYVDLVMVNEMYQGNPDLIKSKSDSVYKVHNITEEQYKSTIKHYEENPERWKQFFNKAEKYLREKRNKNKS